MELAPGTAVLPRGAEGVQIGADPDHHLVLTGLTAPQRAWLLRAARAAVPPQPGATDFPRAARVDAPPPGSDHLVALIGAAGLLAAGPEPHARPPSVRIDGLDGVTAPAAVLLARSGVRSFDLVDPRRVDLSMRGTLPTAMFALPRPRAVRDLLASVDAQTLCGRLPAPDVVVVSRPRRLDDAVAGMLLVEDRRHLLVVQHERSVVVGPLVRPGITACAQCLDLRLADADPSWPMLTRQMGDWPLPAPPAAAAHVAALEVARCVLARGAGPETGSSALGPALGGDPGRTRAHIDPSGRVRFEAVSPHPRCGCGAAGRPFA